MKQMHKLTSLGCSALIIAGMASLPLWAPRAVMQDMFSVLGLLVLALNWNLLAGFAGLVSVGQQGFVGIGAYAMFGSVILWGWDPLAGVLMGGVVAAALAIPAAFFAFRLNGAYFAIGTWVLADIARLVFGQWKALGGGTGTSLPKGTTRDMLGVGPIKDMLDISSAAAADTLLYWVMLALGIATFAASWVFLRSKAGRGLQAIRDNVAAAQAVGVDPVRLKAAVFVLCAFCTGLCGALIFIQITRVTPQAAFSVIDWTAFIIFIVVIGGIGTLAGPIVGVALFYILQRALADYGSVYLILLGAIGIGVMLCAKKGIWGLLVAKTGFDPLPLSHPAPFPSTAQRRNRL